MVRFGLTVADRPGVRSLAEDLTDSANVAEVAPFDRDAITGAQPALVATTAPSNSSGARAKAVALSATSR